jgi:DMSO reductase family type II enzyme heme b subunit
MPTDEDLFRTITNGIPGTSMPSWRSIPEKERRALVEHIKTFDERFKTQPRKPIGIASPPPRTPQLLAKGKQLYQDAGCNDCHGATGQGDGPSAGTLKDDWENPITPYDFTKGGRYKAGSSVRDIYRTFTTGMAGTPMPSFEDSLAADQRWALAYYVQSLSERPTGPAPKEEATVTSKFIKTDLSAPDPIGPIWKEAPAVDILLRPLWLKEGYVDRVRVRSLHNGKEIAFLVEWEDPTKNADLQRLEVFRDAAALQFPTKADGVPSFPMGEAAQAVNIWQWRVDREGNGRGSVENLAAAGFGTLTRQLSQDVKGKGIWSKGKWRVVFSRVMTGGGEVVGLAPGKVMPVAFAVWNGAISQRDGEKSVSTWAFLKIERPTQ